MSKIGFNNDLYISMQSENILKRIAKFEKLYLEFGGKLFDDYHASRVLPGFMPDSKLKMLLTIKDKVEMMIVINADHISSKVRKDFNISYDQELMRLIDAFKMADLYIGSIIITNFKNQEKAIKLREKLEANNYKVAYHYPIPNYPMDVDFICSKEGFGKDEYIKTTKPLVVITAPGPGSGKLATCLSQIYNDYQHNIKAGYAKYETFPIWNQPLKSKINIAYEAATADLNDVNMIDPFHLEAYNEKTVNYNRDVESIPIVSSLLKKIMGHEVYKSPTDMGVNMVGFCISDQSVCDEASENEIIRRYYDALVDKKRNDLDATITNSILSIIHNNNIDINKRDVVKVSRKLGDETKQRACAIKLSDGTIDTCKTSSLLWAASACLINAAKHIAGIDKDFDIFTSDLIKPLHELKTSLLKGNNPRLHVDEILIFIAMIAINDERLKSVYEAFYKLKNAKMHSTVILNQVDIDTINKLNIDLSQDPNYHSKKLYRKN